MVIQVGEQIPNVTLMRAGNEGPVEITTEEIFVGKKVLLFALPGAFTPTCSAAHLPGYVVHLDSIKAKGVDTVACLSVNDGFVLSAWRKTHNADGIMMLADGSAAFTEAVGLELDLTARHMGIRSQRYAMLVDNGTVTHLNVEKGANFEVSNAETMLELL